MIEMILLRRVLGPFVLFRSDSLPAAIPRVANGDSSVTIAGSQEVEGSWKDDVRDHANLQCSEPSVFDSCHDRVFLRSKDHREN